MPQETRLAGKDAALETSIAFLQERLAQIGFHVEEKSWLNPAEGIWSVHLRDRDCPLLFSNGKGATQLACRASALGEFFERLSTRYFWTHYFLGEEIANRDFVHDPRERWFPLPKNRKWPKALLTPELQGFYNPDNSIPPRALVDLNSGNAARGLCALPYTRLRDGQTVWFPVNIIGNLYVSNGMSAGNSPTEARTQALSEILERHVKFTVIAEGLCLPDVPEAAIARYPHIAAGIAALRAAGFGILVKDASLGGQFPVMNVTLLNPRDQGCYVSFGAHPRCEIALERALTELLQGRALDALEGFPPPGFDLDEIASAPNLEIHFVDSSGIVHWNFLGETPDFDFHDWDFSTPEADTHHDAQWLADCIHALGHDIYCAEFTQLGVYTCRILVPGLSEIYPVDDLEWENNSRGNDLRSAVLSLPHLDAAGCAALLETLDAAEFDDQRLVRELIGLAADPGTLWDDLRIGELKALLALSCGDAARTREGLEWIIHFEQLNPVRRRVYQCIDSLLQLEENEVDCTRALPLLFDADTVAAARDLIEGRHPFFASQTLGANFQESAMHCSLLEAYGKVQSQAQ